MSRGCRILFQMLYKGRIGKIGLPQRTKKYTPSGCDCEIAVNSKRNGERLSRLSNYAHDHLPVAIRAKNVNNVRREGNTHHLHKVLDGNTVRKRK